MASSRESDSIFGPSTVFGRAVASVSQKVPWLNSQTVHEQVVDSQLPSQSPDIDEAFIRELDAISSRPPLAFEESLAATDEDRGHHIIHGVAGSGKTQMLCDRVEALAQQQIAERSTKKPILVLCYNEPLAIYLQTEMARRGIAHQVVVRHFHRWCREQLMAYRLEMPPKSATVVQQVKEVVQRVIDALEHGAIPTGQYSAVFVDEAHDFSRQWLPMLAHLPDPSSNHLVLFFDDSQSVYKRKRTKVIRFRKYGIQTNNVTRLTVNHRNTKPIFNAALRLSGNLTDADDTSDNGVPRLKPQSSGRPGAAVLFFPMTNLREQGRKVAELLQHAHAEGTGWHEMAVLCRNRFQMDVCDGALRYQRVPHQVRRGIGDYDPLADTVKVLSMHACQGLEFKVVVIVESGDAPEGADELEEKQRLLYIAATRAKQKLYLVGLGKSA